MNGSKWKWILPLVATAIMTALSLASFYGGVQRGRDEAVSHAAVDAKRLADVEGKAQATEIRMGERLIVDAVQDNRLDGLEKRQAEVLEKLGQLVDIMWKDEARRQGRQ